MVRRKNGKKKGGAWKDMLPHSRQEYLIIPVIAFALALTLPHIGDAFGGFHGMSEAYFTELGKSVKDNPLSYPHKPDGSIDNNIPPITAYLLGASFTMFGLSEAAARVVPVTFSLLTVLMAYLIGARVYDPKTGLVAAAILAATPMHVLVGRNVQSDAIFVALGLTSVWLYISGRKTAAGFTLGLDFMAKQPAVFFFAGLVAFEVLQKRRLSWGLAKFAAVFLLTLSPYVAYNLAVNWEGYIVGQTSRLMLSVSEEGARHGWDMVENEIFWGLSPLISVCFAAGLAVIAYRRRAEDRMPAIFAVIFIVFFVFYNKHSYYVLPLAPFAALVAARAVAALGRADIVFAATVALVLSGAFYSILMLCADKYGFEEYRRLPSLYAGDPHPNILITEVVSGSYIDVLRYYNPGPEITHLDRLNIKIDDMVPVDYARPTYILLHRSEINPENAPQEYRKTLLEQSVKTDKYALVLFGYAFYEAPTNPHFFTNTRLQIGGGLPFYKVGVIKLDEIRELYLIKLKPGERLFKNSADGYSVEKAA